MKIRQLIACVCVSAPALAQDSVSKIHGLPGDAVSAWSASEQQNDYVVDQSVIRSSWGTVYGIAPIVKASAQRDTLPDFFNKQLSSQAISSVLKSGVPFARSSYSLWTAQGFGVNDDPARNDPGTTVNTATANGYQFGWGFAEFGLGTLDVSGGPSSLNNVIAGVANFTPGFPSRLHVARVAAGINGIAENCNLSQFGVGAVDEDGELAFRADGNGVQLCGSYSALSNNNYFRVRSLLRGGAINVISSSGGSDVAATDWLLAGSGVIHNTPNMISPSLAGRPVLLGSNFNIQYVFEQVAGSTFTAPALAHFAPGVTDHRGAVAYSPLNFPTLFASTVAGTAGILAYTSNGVADSINLWGLAANGNFLAPRKVTLPATISDPAQPGWSNTLMPGPQQFDHYHGATAFRGGNSQVSLGSDQAGNLFAAGVVYYGSVVAPSLTSATNRNNYLAVSKTTPSGTTTWSVAAWTAEATAGPISDGKTIFQNGTTPIGRLSGAAFGPTLSAPMIDSVGNVWFVGELTLNANPGITTVGLLRAVLDVPSFSYKLELVLKQGDVIQGRNTGTAYQIRFLELSGAGGISSGTSFSADISSCADRNMSVAGLATDDARTLGGMVLHASILYDVNGDGQFVRSTGTGGTAGSPDEDYEVLLYLSASKDCNQNSIPDDKDIFDGTSIDLDGNGVPDDCEGVAGVPFCDPGSGGVIGCPCGNLPSGPGRGCNSSLNTGGAAMGGSGVAKLSADSLVLQASSVGHAGVSCSGSVTNVTCILLQGSAVLPAGVSFGDGVRCVSGALKRINTGGSLAGTYSFGPGISAQSALLGDAIPGGAQRYYLVYYRDSCFAFCPSLNFNATNGFRVLWLP